MLKYKPKYSTDILYALFGAIIVLLIAFFISRPTANNDIYMQLIAIDGILSDFDFSGVGGHPIGIALVASFLKLCSVDPLIFFYWIQPIIAGLCFIILYNLLTKVLEDAPAFFISLSSLGSLIMIKAMNQLTAEVVSLLTILLFISYVWKNFIINGKNNIQSYILMIFLAWLTILFRNASIFIIFGVLLFLFIHNKHGNIQLLIIGFMMLLPGLIKSFYFYDNPGYLEKILSINMPSEIINQLFKHCMHLTEIILPYSVHLNRMPAIKLIVGMLIFCFIIVIIVNRQVYKKNYKDKIFLAYYFFTIGILYYILLSIASIYYNYNWGDLYRVSGFGILFILCAFWIYIFSLPNLWRKYLLIILIISSISKISYGLRYELNSQEHRFLFNDYQETAANIVEFTNIISGDLLIYTGFKWQGDNLFYILKYYDIIYSKPFNIKQYSREIENTKSMILCTDFDLTKFESSKYKWSLIPNMDKVYLVEIN